MKILQINVFNYKKGGSEAVYFNTIDLLKEHDNEVVNFALKWKDNYPSRYGNYFPESKETRKGVTKPIKNAINYFYHFEATKRIDELIKKERPDIAHIHLIWGQITSSILPVLKRYNIPIILSIHDYRLVCPAYTFRNGREKICEQCHGRNFYYCIANKCTKNSYFLSFVMALEQYFRNTFFFPATYIDGLIYVSNFAKNIHEKYMPTLKNKKSVVLYNFTDNIESVCTSKSDKYFLFFGRLSYEKGLKTLLSAFLKIPNSKLKIVGTGPLESEIKHLIINNNITNVELLGYKSGLDLIEIVRNAYFVIVPSEWYENNPMTIIESYAAGVPVIGANIGGIPEIIIENRTGYIFSPSNIQELTNIINKAVVLPDDQYLEFCQNALEFADNNFGKQNYYSRLMSFYSQFI